MGVLFRQQNLGGSFVIQRLDNATNHGAPTNQFNTKERFMEPQKDAAGAPVHSIVHTPVPWCVKRRFDVYEDTQQPGVGGTYIGTTRGNGELPEGVAKRCEANARLIAAAPAMLAALRQIRAELCRRHSPFVVETDYAYINEAIAKATK